MVILTTAWQRLAISKLRRYVRLIIATIFLGAPVAKAADLKTDVMQISLRPSDWHHLTFDGIPPSTYREDSQSLLIEVKESSSALIKAFKNSYKVSAITLEWYGSSLPKVTDARHESTKNGDDSPIRLGLPIAGKPPFIPFFAPAWIKAVRDLLILPSNQMFYIWPGARHPPGSSWTSPYAQSITAFAPTDQKGDDGWIKSRFAFDTPIEIVGLWLMADGDNTKSSFQTKVRELSLELAPSQVR